MKDLTMSLKDKSNQELLDAAQEHLETLIRISRIAENRACEAEDTDAMRAIMEMQCCLSHTKAAAMDLDGMLEMTVSFGGK